MKFFRMLAVAALAVTLSACHSGKKHIEDREENVQIETIQTQKLKGVEKRLVEESLSWVGTPYRYAGSDKGKGTDCSGLVCKVYQQVTGKKLPRNSGKQAEFCDKIKRKALKAGDLVFFATGRDKSVISHVGIMIDSNQFVHASASKGVIVSDLDTPYYQRTFMMCGRVP